MKIDRVTITGADDRVDVNTLLDISMHFPFVEWGILYSRSLEGEPRYPSLKWKDHLFKHNEFQLSAHLCGSYSREVMEKGVMVHLDFLVQLGFKRIQINYNFFRSPHFTSFDAIVYWARTNKDIGIIFQWNLSNKRTLASGLGKNRFPENIHFLYDSSGGRGREIIEIEHPIVHYTGYSGGIGPHNIIEVCSKIESHPSQKNVWIDMESKVRNEKDEFDLLKVKYVLEQASKFVTVQTV